MMILTMDPEPCTPDQETGRTVQRGRDVMKYDGALRDGRVGDAAHMRKKRLHSTSTCFFPDGCSSSHL